MFKKCMGIFILAAVLASIVGCGPKTPLQANIPPVNSPDVFANLEGEFVLLSDATVPSTLPAFSYKEPLSASRGEGILFGDKTSSIEIKPNGANVDVTVDDKSLSFYAENFVGANIVDLAKNDNLCELAIYFEGASADPSVAFLRYDGTDLKNITHTTRIAGSPYTSDSLYCFQSGRDEDVLPTYGTMWTNQNGVVVTSFQQIGFTKPRLALAYFALENDTWVEHEVPVNTGETYSISNDFRAFFTPMDTPPQNYSDLSLVQNYEFEAMQEFKKGQSITLFGYGKMHNYYTFYVDIDGEKGVLAFWTGD